MVSISYLMISSFTGFIINSIVSLTMDLKGFVAVIMISVSPQASKIGLNFRLSLIISASAISWSQERPAYCDAGTYLVVTSDDFFADEYLGGAELTTSSLLSYCEKDYIEVAKFYKISGKKFFFKVILPQLFPYLLSSARSGLSLIWKIVLVVELLGRSNGVGFKLFGFFQFFDISGILAYTLVFVLLIIFVEFILVRPFERKISIWR